MNSLIHYACASVCGNVDAPATNHVSANSEAILEMMTFNFLRSSGTEVQTFLMFRGFFLFEEIQIGLNPQVISCSTLYRAFLQRCGSGVSLRQQMFLSIFNKSAVYSAPHRYVALQTAIWSMWATRLCNEGFSLLGSTFNALPKSCVCIILFPTGFFSLGVIRSNAAKKKNQQFNESN